MPRVGTGSIEFEATPEGLRVIAAGEFDLSNVPEVERLIAAEMGHETRQVTVDLSQVTFMDSKMLEYLVRLHRWLAPRGGRLRLQPSLNTRRLLELAGLDAVLELANDQNAT